MTILRPPTVLAPPAFDLSHFFNTDVAFFSISSNDGYFKRSNAAFEAMLGWSEPELAKNSFYELIHSDDIPLVLSKLAELEGSGHDVSFDTRFMHKDGRYRWLAWAVQGAEVSESWYATARDITEQRSLYKALEEVQERLRMAMSMSDSGSWGYDVANDHVTLDASAEAVFNITPGQFGGHLADLLALAPAEDHDRINQLKPVRGADQPIETEFRVVAEDGSTRYVAIRGKVVDSDRLGRPLRAVGIAWNITNQKQMEQQLLDLVVNDRLTGLKNRRSFDESIRSEWRRSEANERALAVVMMDIDDFKQVNDTFGHQVGDRYLTSIGRALASVATRPGDVVARYGGEEFVALLPECDADQARSVANRFVEAIRNLNLRHPDGNGIVSISAGSSSVRPSGDLSADRSIAALLRTAGSALCTAKAGRANGSSSSNA